MLNTAIAALDLQSSDWQSIQLIRGGLAEDLLWYDRVTVVSSTFWEVQYLLKWFGPDVLREMCERDEVHFVRIPNTLGYVSASGARNLGLKSEPGVIALRSGGDREGRNSPHPNDWREQMERVVHSTMPWGHSRSDQFTRQLEVGVTDFPDPSDHLREVILSTRQDMLQSDLRGIVLGDTDLDPMDLPEGHAGRQALLRIASANHYLLLLAATESTHLHAEPLVGDVLSSKLSRVLPRELRVGSLTQLLELKDMPSVSKAINSGAISFNDVVEIRRSENAQRFRDWLQANVGGEGREDAVRAYVSALEESGYTSLQAKVARFIVSSTLAVGLELIVAALAGAGAGVGAGVAVGAFDTFLVERLRQGWTPGMFLDDELARHLAGH